MRLLFTVLLGYLTLVATSLLLLFAMRQILGAEALLEPGEWRLAGWFAVLGPMLIVVPGLVTGVVAGWIGRRMKSGLLLAVLVLAMSLTATFTEVRRASETDERAWTPKFTEMIRRVREPMLAMVVGSFTLSASIVAGVVIARTAGLPRRLPERGPVVHRDTSVRSAF
jgi:MFS family permease